MTSACVPHSEKPHVKRVITLFTQKTLWMIDVGPIPLYDFCKMHGKTLYANETDVVRVVGLLTQLEKRCR